MQSPDLFQRIVAGIDGTPSALHACVLANRLRAPSGYLLAVAVAETPYVVHTGLGAPEVSERLRADAVAARDAVLRELDDPRVDAQVVEGRADEQLLRVIAERRADLVGVGRGALSRAAGIVLGSVTTRLIHDAPCSVLVTRGVGPADRFPRRILVGLDGSEHAAEAAAVAQLLADQRDATVRRIAATSGKPLSDWSAVDAELDPRSPVDALVEESARCDLMIVGSRGLHGVASLGSVAERVAHAAECSVLIVRG